MSSHSHSTEQDRSLNQKLGLPVMQEVWPNNRVGSVRYGSAHQIYTEGETLPPSQRLIVILPDANHDIFTIPKQIWNLAAPDGRQVLLLTKPCRDENEFRSRMNLTTVASLIRDTNVAVQTKMVIGISLEQAVRQYAQPDDVIVCYEKHFVPSFLQKKRLTDILAKTTKLPVYTLRGSVSEMTDPVNEVVMDIVLLLVAIAMLFGFFVLEIWIDHNSTGVFRTIIEMIVVCVEVWIIAACANRSFKI